MLISYRLTQTSVILRVKVRNVISPGGGGLVGLTPASSGLRISAIADVEAATTAYDSAGGTIESIAVPGTYAAPAGGKCRFGEVDPARHPGVYEVQLVDARFAVAGAKSLLVTLLGATNMAEADALIPLPLLDPYAAKVAATLAGADVSGKVPASLAAGDVSGYLPADIRKYLGADPAGGPVQVDLAQAMPTSPAAGSLAAAILEKAGFQLAATGLDLISVAPASGVPGTFREGLVWGLMRQGLWGSVDRTGTSGGAPGTIKVYLGVAPSGDPVTTQSASDDGAGHEVLGGAT